MHHGSDELDLELGGCVMRQQCVDPVLPSSLDHPSFQLGLTFLTPSPTATTEVTLEPRATGTCVCIDMRVCTQVGSMRFVWCVCV